jgi:hypothetical protein
MLKIIQIEVQPLLCLGYRCGKSSAQKAAKKKREKRPLDQFLSGPNKL